ncbi:hypothetical protein SHKM778_66920 [Streptomyces sp. KM77-8]|uniref:Uncharacterized protein n=1 Tax=Streptomyces haneummycinicus TaxID=3074435 RepID=A0AAT9HS72_9ACTN
MTGEFVLDGRQAGGIGDGPQTVVDTVLRGGRQQGPGPGRAFDQGGGRGRPPVTLVSAVGEQQRFEVRGGGPHQLRTVGDDVRHDVLVRQDQPFAGLGDAKGADDATLHHAVAVALFVDVETGFGVGGQDALGAPAAQGVGGLGVARPGRVGLGQDQPDDVVRIGGLEVVQAVGADDDVVRRDVTEARPPTRSGS